MRWFFVGALGVSALAMGGQEALSQEAPMVESRAAMSKVTKSSKGKKAKRGAVVWKRRVQAAPSPLAVAKQKKSGAGERASALPMGPMGIKAHPASVEPAPAGELAVYWAQPQNVRLGVKIRQAPSRESTALGEMRGDTAVPIRLSAPSGAGPALQKRSGCRGWLEAQPEGYICLDEVQLHPGYLSDPPAQERPTAWQRFRYGVIKVASAVLEHGPGQPAAQSAGYLRSILHRGDGITVVKELEDRVQIYGKKWLRKMDVALVTPPALQPINMQAVPSAQRFLIAWAVPPAGETQVALFPTVTTGTGTTTTSTPPLWIPRYSQLWWSDTKASPGRIAVYLTDETRAALGTRPDAASGAQRDAVLPGAQFEIDVKELRRVTPAPLPVGLQEGERWIDISLNEQVAIAYSGDAPLFASLVSTGAGTTPPGSFFIYRKYLTQTMANLTGSASQYDFREVPYAQFFNGRIGLHAVLWHDLLGHPVSHGCVNMSPAAAEQFFSFTKPEMPSGWHTVNGLGPRPRLPSASFRGTRVVVRR